MPLPPPYTLAERLRLLGAEAENYDRPIDMEAVRREIAAVDNIDERIFAKRTALITVASSGYTEIVQALLDAGAQHDLKDDGGNTARDWCYILRRHDTMQVLDLAAARAREKEHLEAEKKKHAETRAKEADNHCKNGLPLLRDVKPLQRIKFKSGPG